MNKLAVVFYKFKSIFDMKDTILALRESEISYLRHQLTLQQQDSALARDFVSEAHRLMVNFLRPIKTHLQELSENFNQIYDGNKIAEPKLFKSYSITFKKGIREILLSVQNILDKEPLTTELSIKQLKTDFEKRLKMVNFKAERMLKTGAKKDTQFLMK